MKERYKSKIAVFLFITRNNDMEVLLQKRKNTGYMDGMYDASCSGHLEEGESMTTAIVREAKEELGINIKESDLKLVSVSHEYKDGYIQFYFVTLDYKGTPKIIEEDKCDELLWVNVNDLPKNIIPKIKRVIEVKDKYFVIE